MDFKLEVGRAETVVEVADAASLVNTETQTVSTVISTTQVLELPTVTRNPYDLVMTAGAVSEDDPSAGSQRGVGAAINGQRAASTNVLLDGASNNDEFTAGVGQQVPLDSVQEFSVITSNFTAEFGRAGGGVVNVATKGGTNDFHGTAYEFNRVSKLSSNEFDNNANGIDKARFTRNQFGYSIGGPIKSNKLFFFNNIEWIKVRSAATEIAMIPTTQLVAATAPATQNFFKAYGATRKDLRVLQTFTKGDLAAAGVKSFTGARFNALPDSLPMFQKTTYSVPTDAGGGDPQNTYMLVGRVDYNMSDKTQVYGRYALNNGKLFQGVVVNSPYAGFDSGQTDLDSNYLASVIHTFSPRLNGQTKIVFNRLNMTQPLGDNPIGPTLYFLGSTVTRLLGTDVALPGYSQYTPGNSIPFGGPQNYAQIYQDFNYTAGKHSLRFGGSFVYIRDNRTFGAYEAAVEQLGTNMSGAMENFLAGQLYSFTKAIYPQGKYPCGATQTADCTINLPAVDPSFSRSNRYKEFAFYGQDAWRVTPQQERRTRFQLLSWRRRHQPGRFPHRQGLYRSAKPDGQPVGQALQELRSTPRLRVGCVRQWKDQHARRLRHRLRAQLRQRNVQHHPEPAEPGCDRTHRPGGHGRDSGLRRQQWTDGGHVGQQSDSQGFAARRRPEHEAGGRSLLEPFGGTRDQQGPRGRR
jgi:hypothetical protein